MYLRYRNSDARYKHESDTEAFHCSPLTWISSLSQATPLSYISSVLFAWYLAISLTCVWTKALNSLTSISLFSEVKPFK